MYKPIGVWFTHIVPTDDGEDTIGTVAEISVEQPETDSSTVMEDDIEDWNSNEEGAGTKGEIFYLSAITMHRLYLVGTCW